MWRHGTVHNFTPFVYYSVTGKKKVVVEWTSNRSDEQHNRDVNLRTFDRKGCDGLICLSVNTCQLADDLLDAFDNFVGKMERNQSFHNGCIRRLRRSLMRRNCMSLKKVGQNKKEEIRKQILLARDSTKGMLDERNQVQWYSNSQ
jgi:hypothetical protein